MGWEKRGNGDFYYRKERVGSKVVSRYFGGDYLAQLVSSLDESDRATRLIEKIAIDEEIANDQRHFHSFQEIEGSARKIIQAAYLINGFCLHKGQWRKKRAS